MSASLGVACVLNLVSENKISMKSNCICIFVIFLNSYYCPYASGEAVYVDDIPSPKDCVYGAFVYSTKPLARVKKIDFKPSLASEKILAVITAKDIPKDGENIGSISQFGSEALFADLLAEYAGQPLGVVVLFFLFVFYSGPLQQEFRLPLILLGYV